MYYERYSLAKMARCLSAKLFFFHIISFYPTLELNDEK